METAARRLRRFSLFPASSAHFFKYRAKKAARKFFQSARLKKSFPRFRPPHPKKISALSECGEKSGFSGQEKSHAQSGELQHGTRLTFMRVRGIPPMRKSATSDAQIEAPPQRPIVEMRINRRRGGNFPAAFLFPDDCARPFRLSPLQSKKEAAGAFAMSIERAPQKERRVKNAVFSRAARLRQIAISKKSSFKCGKNFPSPLNRGTFKLTKTFFKIRNCPR